MPRIPFPIASQAAAAPLSMWSRLMRLLAGSVLPASRRAVESPWAAPNPPERRLPKASDYALRHVIARNDRSTIYQALERPTGRLVALKTVRFGAGSNADRELWRDRFLREAAAAARLQHDHIVRVHAGGVQGEGNAVTGWLAMEWVHGTDMARYAVPARLLPEAMVLAIGIRVALALDFAHRAGIVHRDMKPSNVLFDPTTCVVKVTDFGSARVADTAATRSGLMLGTPAYMAPEQLAGVDADPRCDLHALGVMLFELLVGRRPFVANSMGDLLARIARETPPRLGTLRADLPPLLDDIVARLLSKSPGDRQADARQVALELRLARAQCEGAEPGEAGAAWADTSPGGDTEFNPVNDEADISEFQGTIAE